MTVPQPWRAHLFALAAYMAATLIFFASALPTMGGAFPGGPVADIDGWQNVWHLWWTHYALSQRMNPLQTPLLFYPNGVNLAVHPLNLAAGVLLAPVTASAGPVAAYNVAVLAAFVLSGFGAYLLALRVGAAPGSAWVAGLLFTFSPFHVTKAYDGQLEMISLQWVAFYAWLLSEALAPERRRWLPLAGIALALVGYTSLYYLLYAAILSALIALLWAPWRSGAQAVGAHLLRLLTVPAVAALALTPLLLKLGVSLSEVRGGEGAPGVVDSLLLARSANLVDFWLPSYLHPLWGAAVAQLGPILHPSVSAWNNALGYTAVALAIGGCLRSWQRAWRWLVIAVAGLLLALGPELQVGGLHTGIALPYRLVMRVPGMDTAHRPGHFAVLVTLALVPLAGLGLSWLAARYGRAALVLATLAAALELASPGWPLHAAAVSPIYAQLANTPGALMVVPVNIDSSDVLRDQIIHQRPLVGGFLARTPPYPFVDLTPGVRQLWRLRPEADTLASPAGASTLDLLDAFDVRDVVVRWPAIPPAQREAARQAIAQVLPGVTPTIQDDTIAVYHIPVGARQPFAYVGSGWYPEEHTENRRWRWMGASGDLMLMNPTGAPAAVVLHLRAESYRQPRPVALNLNDTALGTWTVSAQPVSASISLRLLLPPGQSRLSLAAPSEAEPAGRGPISIVLSAVAIETP